MFPKLDGIDHIHVYVSDRKEADLLLRCSDHTKAWPLYFNDLDGNMHEITTYDYDDVSAQLKSV